jgi:hypothetical protein
MAYDTELQITRWLATPGSNNRVHSVNMSGVKRFVLFARPGDRDRFLQRHKQQLKSLRQELASKSVPARAQ